MREPKPPRLKLVDCDREGVVVEVVANLVVDERIEQKVNDLQEGINTTSFDIHDHSSEIVDMIDEFDIDHKIEQWFQNNTFSVTVD